MGARRMWSGMAKASTRGTAMARSSRHKSSTSLLVALTCGQPSTMSQPGQELGWVLHCAQPGRQAGGQAQNMRMLLLQGQGGNGLG